MPCKKVVWIFVIIGLIFLSNLSSYPRLTAVIGVPNHIYLTEGRERMLEFPLPLTVHLKPDKYDIIQINDQLLGDEFKLNLNSPVTLRPLKLGEVEVQISLFGLIPFGTMTVEVFPEVSVILGGDSIGVLLTSQGVIVVGYEQIRGIDGSFFSPGKEAGLQLGDVIIKVEEEPVYDRTDLTVLINKHYDPNNEIILTVNRGHIRWEIPVKPVINRFGTTNFDGFSNYSIGVTVEDSAAGVGTLTFYHPESGRYGALGHMVTSTQFGEEVAIRDGRIVRADIRGIEQGSRGVPGEKIGVFRGWNDVIGTIDTNSGFGIYGEIVYPDSSISDRRPVPVGLSHQVVEGPAQILTVLKDDKIERFNVMIEQVANQKEPDIKGLVIRVVDPRLLEQTGGIIQGMSGSPIIQDGKFIGAITHVFVNDPTRGYGILAEWMILKSGVFNEEALSYFLYPNSMVINL